MLFASCCGGGDRRKKKRNKRQKSLPTSFTAGLSSPTNKPLNATSLSVVSDEGWEDCREDFSTDGDPNCRRTSFSTEGHHTQARHRHLEGAQNEYLDKAYSGRTEFADPDHSGELHDRPEDANMLQRLAGCLTLLERTSADGSPAAQRHASPQRSLGSPMASMARSSSMYKPRAGASLARKPAGTSDEDAHECWEECDATTYNVRSVDYMRSKIKVPSSKAFYKLIGVDFFTCDSKISHVAQRVVLPKVRKPKALEACPDCPVPPLLIINLQLPTYAPPIWGGGDGPGVSIVYYFALSEDFDPLHQANQLALQLYQRVISNGKEADGTLSRDRCKLIARVANVDDWAVKAPLNTAEHRLLLNYNEKPVMTRPQHRFHFGPGYMEMELDIHSYAFLARKAMHAFVGRLSTVVFEVALVVQGNSPEELPEQVLACGRVYRVNFEAPRPLPSPV